MGIVISKSNGDAARFFRKADPKINNSVGQNELSEPLVAVKKNIHRHSHIEYVNSIAPVIIKNLSEEFQQIINPAATIEYGSLNGCESHPLIRRKLLLVRDEHTRDGPETGFGSLTVDQHDLDRYSVFGCSQPTSNGLQYMMDDILSKYSVLSIIILRGESVFYLKTDTDYLPYSLRSVDNVDQIYVDESLNDPVTEEMIIRREILSIATMKDQNQFYVYDDVNNVQGQPLCIHLQFEDDLLTLDELFSRSVFKRPQIKYHRLQFPRSKPPSPQFFDTIISIYTECPSFLDYENHATLFCCQNGKVASSYGMAIVGLLDEHKNDFIPLRNRNNSNPGNDVRVQPRAVSRLVQHLENGCLIKQQVDTIIDECSAPYNLLGVIAELREALNCLITNGGSFNDEQVKKKCQNLCFNCLLNLRKYLILLCFNAYLTQHYKEKFFVSFALWMNSQPELLSIISHADLSHTSLHFNHLANGDIKLKADQQEGSIIGSPFIDLNISNFRRIAGFPVYGLAQCNCDMMKKLVRHLIHTRRHSMVVLICVRDDPFLQCDGRIYSPRANHCLRKHLHLSGLTASEIENIEEEIKNSILSSRALLSVVEESDQPEKEVRFNEVLTITDIWSSIHSVTPEFLMHRIPMNLKEAISHTVFERMLEVSNDTFPKISQEGEGPAILISCQSGKSQTTVAMVIMCLIMCHKKGFPYGCRAGEQERVSLPCAQYTLGDYLIVQKLIKSLPNGQQVKREVDFILDKCFESMSTVNFHLREIIFVTYKQMKTAKSSKERKKFKLQSLIYLEIYLNLILFNAYLHDAPDCENVSFSRWMKDVGGRIKLYDIIDNLSFSDFEQQPSGFETRLDRWSAYGEDTTFRGEFI